MNGLLQHVVDLYAVSFVLLTMRSVATLMFVPTFTGVSVPKRVRGAAALLIALVLTPSATTNLAGASLASLAVAALGEIFFGLAMGLVVRLSFFAAEFAGGALGLQMGLAFSQVVDPLSKERNPISSRILGIFATMLFVAADAHRMVLAALAGSVSSVVPGSVFAHVGSPQAIFSLLSVATSTGLRIAAPVMVSLFLANVALALLARAAPQLQLFALSFGLSIMLGFIILMASSRFGLGLVAQQVQHLGQDLASLAGL